MSLEPLPCPQRHPVRAGQMRATRPAWAADVSEFPHRILMQRPASPFVITNAVRGHGWALAPTLGWACRIGMPTGSIGIPCPPPRIATSSERLSEPEGRWWSWPAAGDAEAVPVMVHPGAEGPVRSRPRSRAGTAPFRPAGPRRRDQPPRADPKDAPRDNGAVITPAIWIRRENGVPPAYHRKLTNVTARIRRRGYRRQT